ncbi:Inositol 2-dehydrogenase/D-chiro-inositol 3-dehydrogenase [subsurface metagenome]
MKNNQKLKVAIVGCGAIALDHLGAIKANCEPVELHLCDQNPEAAIKLKQMIGLDAQFHPDALQVFCGQRFDIVHVLTPPDSHYDIAMHALKNRANVIVEKPMTLTLKETKKLYLLAEEMNQMVCVDHSLLYMECVLKAFELIKSGVLGRVIGAHCFFGHAERRNTIPYGGVSHWAYNIPGGPLANIISHPASLIVELLGKPESIKSISDARNLMPYGFSDLLDVSFRTSKGHGSFTVSMAHGNSSRYANIECEKGSIYVDLGRQLTVVKFHKGRLGFISKALSSIGVGFSFINGTLSVIFKVATKKLKRNPGTRKLIAEFYRCVRDGSPPPVSKENAVSVATVFEKVLGAKN